MSGPTFLDFARMANACYYANDPLVPVYTRVFYGQLESGFKASRYTANVGAAGGDTVVCFAGTDSDETEVTDSGDKLADLGFAGAAVAGIVSQISPLLGLAVSAGQRRLMEQVNGALEFTRQAQYFGGPQGRVYVCGHSLGGGLAQIICAQLGLQGVAFNAPAVSQMGYSIAPPERFFCVNQARDPVSGGTSFIGGHLGTVINIDNGSGLAAAHFLGPIVSYLESGSGAALGARHPF